MKWDGKSSAPAGACQFLGQGESVQFAAGEGERKKVRITGYRGDIIEHWFWGNLAMDMDGLKFSKAKTPGLIDHDTRKRLTFSKSRSLKPETYIEGDTSKGHFSYRELKKRRISNIQHGMSNDQGLMSRRSAALRMNEQPPQASSQHLSQGDSPLGHWTFLLDILRFVLVRLDS